MTDSDDHPLALPAIPSTRQDEYVLQPTTRSTRRDDQYALERARAALTPQEAREWAIAQREIDEVLLQRWRPRVCIGLGIPLVVAGAFLVTLGGNPLAAGLIPAGIALILAGFGLKMPKVPEVPK